jgi:formylglycine-generating enzyme required for sulfatase activity
MQGRSHPIASRFRLKLFAFGTGLVVGSFLIGAVSLPLFVAFSVKADSPQSRETDKYRGVEIKPQTPKPPAGGSGASSAGTSAVAGGADTDDFIEGNYWALIIGVNKYPNMDKDKQLEAARVDAEAVAKLLVERYGFPKEKMVELYDEQATRKGILRAFNNLKRRLTDKDSLFVYYAGHGEYEESKDKSERRKRVDGMGYWIPSDAEVDDPSSYIFNSQVRDYLANIEARHIYAVVDSCFSLSLMGRSRALGRGAIKELYQSKSRWVLTSGGLYPVPDAADKSKGGHSTFAWHFMRVLRKNTDPYLLAKDIAEPVAVGVSNEVKDQLPRSGQVVGAGDDGGQFVFRLRKEFQRDAAKLAAADEAELNTLDDQLKKAEEALKKQQEDMAQRKQAMLGKIRQAQEQAAREAAAEEERLRAEIKTAEEKAKRDAEARQARLKEEEERVRKAQEERLAAAKKFEEEQKERERKAREAELARQKLEEERKVEEARLAELKQQAEEKERQRLADLKRQEDERKAEEARLAAELKKREEEEKVRIEAERIKMEALRKKQEEEKEASRLAELKRQEDEVRKTGEARRKTEEEKIAELKRQAEEKERQRLVEVKRKEEERKVEEARLAELKQQAEEKERQRLVELKRQEEERRRIEAETKAAKEREVQRLAEFKRKQEEEEQRFAEEKRQAEEKRLADERERIEREKQALLKRQQEEELRRKAEQARLAALAREAEEQKRKIEEAQKKAEEDRKALLAQKEAAKAAKTGAAPIIEATLRPFQAPKAKDLATVVTIPAGEFVMGSKPGDGQLDESPQRTVYLDAYTIDKFEVTVEQYAAYLKKAGAEAPDFWERVNRKEDGNRPVVGVDWLDASEYCEYYGKRLPTEAQWEKAARGTDGRRYPWGNDDPSPLFANFASGVAFSYSKSLSPVGSYESGKSPYGAYDMVGNVWEWILDWYERNYYQIAPQKNPAGPASGDTKVIRGGSWAKRPAVARVAGRTSLPTSSRSNAIGFRCIGEVR